MPGIYQIGACVFIAPLVVYWVVTREMYGGNHSFSVCNDMKYLFGLVFVLAAAFLYPQTSRTENEILATILSALRRADAVREEAIHDMVYTAETSVVEWEDASRREIKSETLSVRRVYVLEPNQIHNEYLSMTIDGRTLSRKEMERELAKQRRGGSRQGEEEFQSPFSDKVAGLYEFELKGEELFEGREVWLVGFNPKEPEENLFTGTAFVSRSEYQPLYVEMAPAKLPRVLEEFAMSIRFAPVGENWLPSVFSMDMRVRISFLVTLADRSLSIEDRYSDYRLNVGLDPSIFVSE